MSRRTPVATAALLLSAALLAGCGDDVGSAADGPAFPRPEAGGTTDGPTADGAPPDARPPDGPGATDAAPDAPLPPTCPAANPNDDQPDDAALQACLDQGGALRLEPGSPGYLLATGLVVSQDGTTLTSTAAPTRARLVAAPGLMAPLLQMTGRSNVSITFLEIDGNRPSRTGIASCQGYRIFGTNVALEGSQSFGFNDNRSTRAMCGSALQVNGQDFELARNLVDDNGHGREAPDAPEPWSDGITLGRCQNGMVHDNQITDATDIAIVDGGGPGCQIQNNTIAATSRHAFGGIALHVFTAEGNGDHTGSVISGNHISAATGRLSIGLSVGMHSWFPATTARGGSVTGNDVAGAIVNLQVDGVDGVTVSGNTIGATSGSPGCGGAPAGYTVAHATASSLQPGALARIYDGCIP